MEQHLRHRLVRTSRGVYRLSRWQEHIPFVCLISLLGAKLAGGGADIRLGLVLVANVLVVCFAFMINDIEDAADDALDPVKGRRNPVSNGDLSRWGACLAAGAVGALSLGFFALIGRMPFLLGAFALLLGWLYSWRPIRLKAVPVADLLSHSLMLAGLQVLCAYYAYSAAPWSSWPVLGGIMAASMYGELYNELDDLAVDTQARVRTTATVLGRRWTRALMYALVLTTILLLGLTIWRQLVPLWVIGLALILLPVAMQVMPHQDARGAAAGDLTGELQLPALVSINLVVAAWFLADYGANWWHTISTWLVIR